MTTYNTGNPVGSTDPRDLYDNAQNLDALVNSTTELSHADRMGVQRKTWHGMEAEFDAEQAQRSSEFAQFLADSAYQDLGVYGAGIEVTRYNQVFLKDGEFYRAAATLVLPYTTTGVWVSESASFVGVGDAVLRKDLQSTGGANGAALVGSDDGSGGSLFTTVAGFVALIMSSLGSSIIGFIQDGVGAVRRSIMDVLRERVSVFDFMTEEQIEDVQAYTYGIDVTAAVQSAIKAAFDKNKDLFAPAGGYLVTGLYLPGRVSGGVDDRGKSFRMYGQGTGEPFVVSAPRGTVFKSVTDAPVIQDYLDTAASSNGQVDISRIRFDGTSNSAPVVLLQSFYGLSELHHCVVYQRGTSGGIKMGWGATVDCHHNYVLNKDWATTTLGAARTGTGIEYAPTADNGLVTIRKCTSRGWLDAYKLGGGTGTAYSASIENSEASLVYNGITLAANADKCSVSKNYLEGGDGGVGINNLGDYNTISDNLIFQGFAVGIQDTSSSNKGSLIQGNLVGLGSRANSTGIDVVSSAAFGGYNKNVVNNSVSYAPGTNGVTGIKLSGETPRVDITGNSFDPRGNWTGSGTKKISDVSTGGLFGITTAQSGDWEFPVLSSGAISLFRGVPALTEANVSSGNMTLSDGSYFTVTATVATAVNRFSAGETAGRFVILRTTNANTTFSNSAYLRTAGGAAFSGPGTITFFIDRVGADSYAYELCRTTF